WVRARQAAVEAIETRSEPDPREALFFRHACQDCHAIQGTEARSNIGPDLTHLANRRTLAAATMPNTPETLAAWIADPHVAKPGNRMPETQIEPDELEALVDYLFSLDTAP